MNREQSPSDLRARIAEIRAEAESFIPRVDPGARRCIVDLCDVLLQWLSLAAGEGKADLDQLFDRGGEELGALTPNNDAEPAPAVTSAPQPAARVEREEAILVSQLVNAARQAGFDRGRRIDDTDDNRAEDAAVDRLLSHVAALRQQLAVRPEDTARVWKAGYDAAAKAATEGWVEGVVLEDRHHIAIQVPEWPAGSTVLVKRAAE